MKVVTKILFCLTTADFQLWARRFLAAVCFLLLFLFCGCGVTGYGAHRITVNEPLLHTVVNGESVWSISQKYGVNYKSVLRLNGIRDPQIVAVGQVLFLGFRRAPLQPRMRPPSIPRGTGRLSWPLRSGRLVSRFGPRGGSFHDGIDLAAPYGTPVYAAHSGSVVYVGSKLGGYGKLIILRGNDGFISVYAHNQRLLLSSGQKVTRGQKIAEVGSTGKSTGPHLHFEVRMKDRRGRYVAVDPLPILDGNGKKPRYRVNESLTPLLAKRKN